MGAGDIGFPNLGIYLHNVPKTFTVFGFEIALYGVIIAVGIMAGLLMASAVAKRHGQDPDMYWDAIVWLVLFGVAGARIYYVIFMWDHYKDDLLQIFNLRAGGLAIYGGVIGAVTTVFVYCRIKKKDPYIFLDTSSCGLILGQAIGRWGNFFNREVFGEYTDNLFAMQLPVAAVRNQDISARILEKMPEGANYIQVHPTFLYESIWNLIILCLMLLYFKHRRFNGEGILLYFAGYGIGRAYIESIRTDQLYITGTRIPVSMCLGIIMAVGSVILDIVIRTGMKKGKFTKLAIRPAEAAAGETAAGN